MIYITILTSIKTKFTLSKSKSFYMENSINIAIWKESVFSDFFKNHKKSLCTFLLYKYGNENHAEDVAQEAFIKLWQNSSKIPIEKAKSYIYTLAKNASLNVIAHEKVKLSYEKNNAFNDTSNENPEFLLEEKQFKDKLLKKINNLRETQRTAFILNRIDGKKYAEIAQELNISVKAVEKRIHFALIELRKEFKHF